ncbi:MAG: hypothetical protein QOI35_2677 [Cryptosporangiaceae bacterium]|jgi:Tol biopolymer transport system component|nr:hypothetical protein [Cryptosporangiaceae bacterium]
MRALLLARITGAGVLAATAALALDAPAHAAVVTVDRVSVATDGSQGDDTSLLPATDDSGRYVAFASLASTLVPGDTNRVMDIFVRDTDTGTTTLVSAAPDGTPANRGSIDPRMSADGRFVEYWTQASNISEPGQRKPGWNVYVYDRETGTNERVPSGSSGAQNGDLSGDGRYVTYESTSQDAVPGGTQGYLEVYRYDRQTRQTQLVSTTARGSEAKAISHHARISADGRYVAFVSSSAELVAGDTNGKEDVFLRDMEANTTTRVSVGPGGAEADGNSDSPAISADGRVVAFMSTASTLASEGSSGQYEVFARDTGTSTTTLLSKDAGGTPGNGYTSSPEVSGDGSHVVFWSQASNLVPHDTNGAGDTFVHDLAAGSTERVSVTAAGEQAGGGNGVLSRDARFVYLRSDVENLVAGDTNGAGDIFRVRRF